LNVTAIAAINGSSVLECWNLKQPPFDAAGALNYPLGNSTNAFLGIIPPRTHIGQAFAPSVQLSIFLSGMAHISLPNASEASNESEAYIQGGSHGMLIAADTRNVSRYGHITNFPGDEATLIAEFPVAGNKVPTHLVLHRG
ncbi:hypothetical protein BDV97DRAFT_269943, partial [Delphinella strobiligena]